MDYDDLLIETPDDFRYRPAHGNVLSNGVVTVSGFQMTQHDIETKGKALFQLMGVFKRIDDRIQKEKGSSLLAYKKASSPLS